jgi:hypothetical protein
MHLPGIGDRAEIYLDSRFWQGAGWFQGTVVRVDRYSQHRSFYWVELDIMAEPAHGGRTRLVSVLNPRHIRRI